MLLTAVCKDILEFSDQFASAGVEFIKLVTFASAPMHTAVVQSDTGIALMNVLKLSVST